MIENISKDPLLFEKNAMAASSRITILDPLKEPNFVIKERVLRVEARSQPGFKKVSHRL